MPLVELLVERKPYTRNSGTYLDNSNDKGIAGSGIFLGERGIFSWNKEEDKEDKERKRIFRVVEGSETSSLCEFLSYLVSCVRFYF